jgi:hypothetical protein
MLVIQKLMCRMKVRTFAATVRDKKGEIVPPKKVDHALKTVAISQSLCTIRASYCT